jgi:cobalt/nickel transport system ATP-binding protein
VSDSDTVLEVVGATYRYLERFVALDDVSLTVGRGERLALLGANGSGKSTLLKVLAGLLFTDAGAYRAFGADVDEATLEDEQFNRAFRERVGVVFQNPDVQVFSPTVRDELAFGPLNFGMSGDEVDGRVTDVLALLDIADLVDRAPHQLSGGQKKRVAIASVLVTNPEVLLLDEPTAALDPRTQRWLIDLLDELARTGKTIVLATHDVVNLTRLADRALVLGEDHRVARVGPLHEVLADQSLLVGVNLIE